jgi:hypothetical protein
MGDYEFRNVRGHIEVLRNGVFQFSADSMSEARQEVRELEASADE